MLLLSEELAEYQEFSLKIQDRFTKYINHLKKEYMVNDLPRAILWCGRETATKLISDIPVPAYTNEYRVVFTPDIEVWRTIYLSQLNAVKDGSDRNTLEGYYNNELSENHILQILGHEFAHHSPLYLNGFEDNRDSGIWFEESMVEYISRKYFLTEAEYDREYQCNAALVKLLKDTYGGHSLEEFGAATYEGDYASIFFEYWRSFLAIHQIVENYSGNVMQVFASYHQWGNMRSFILKRKILMPSSRI